MISAVIDGVRLLEYAAARPTGTVHTGFVQSRPVGLYPDRHGGATGAPVLTHPTTRRSCYLEIGAAGLVGRYGPVDREVIGPLADGMASALIGLDPMAGTFVWDLLTRLDRHSRHGARKIAISAVDNTLWDLRGRLLGAPVWQLLGGSGRERIEAYASTLGTGHGGGEIERTAAMLLDEGYTAQKWFFTDGPGQGLDGMERNVALAERARAAVGKRSTLMFDAFMSWDLPYARRWCQRVQGLAPDWLEEPFEPAALETYAALGASTTIPLAAGEHLYDRHDILPFLRTNVLGTLQVDPEWCGGVTELTRMCAVAEPYGVPVIPHGHGIHAALHVVASQSAQVCPRVEYLFCHMPDRHHFERDAPAPHGGSFALPTEPGFGIEIDHSKIEHVSELVTAG